MYRGAYHLVGETVKATGRSLFLQSMFVALAGCLQLAGIWTLSAEPATPYAVVLGSPFTTLSSSLVWQVRCALRHRGASNAYAGPIRARVSWGETAKEWNGVTDELGVAELIAECPSATCECPTEIVVTRGDKSVLAQGRPQCRPSVAPRFILPAPIRPTPETNASRLRVYLPHQSLVLQSPEQVWIHIENETTAQGYSTPLEVYDDPSFTLLGQERFADWVRLDIRANYTLVTFRARLPGSAEWFGALPTAPGAMTAALHDQGRTLHLSSLSQRQRAYLEINDAQGREYAASVTLLKGANDIPAAELPLTTLRAGQHWLVVSPSPNGAEALSPPTVAYPLVVNDRGGAWLDSFDFEAAVPASFARWVALDGSEALVGQSVSRVRAAKSSSLVIVALMWLAESALLVRASRRRLATEVFGRRVGRWRLMAAILLLACLFGGVGVGLFFYA